MREKKKSFVKRQKYTWVEESNKKKNKNLEKTVKYLLIAVFNWVYACFGVRWRS